MAAQPPRDVDTVIETLRKRVLGRQPIGQRDHAHADRRGQLARQSVMRVGAADHPPAAVQVEQATGTATHPLRHVETRRHGAAASGDLDRADLGHLGTAVVPHRHEHRIGSPSGDVGRQLPKARRALRLDRCEHLDEPIDLRIHVRALQSGLSGGGPAHHSMRLSHA